jgi:hypothetical protein
MMLATNDDSPRARPTMPNEDYWHALMRRALGVPDHVSEDNRIVAVAWALLQHGGSARVTESEAVTVVNVIAAMGAEGNLDEYFVSFSHGDADTARTVEMAVDRAAICNPDFVRSSLGLVVKWAKDHPYRADDFGAV